MCILPHEWLFFLQILYPRFPDNSVKTLCKLGWGDSIYDQLDKYIKPLEEALIQVGIWEGLH